MLNRFKSFKYLKPYISVLLILATLTALVYYLMTHHSLINSLKNLAISNLVLILGLYFLVLLVLVLIFQATVYLLGIKLSFKLNLLVNIYSLFMNFFIPGQTGPVYRAYILKKEHKVLYRNFLLITVIYFLIYSVISIIFIMIGLRSIRLDLLIVVCLLIGILVFRKYLMKFLAERSEILLKNIPYLVLATLLQVVVQSIIYFVELKTIARSSHLDILSILSYTGVANLAIFVSLTPGAIGIREAFLLITKNLIHISSSSIILANLVDRAINILFLGMLGIFILIFHINKRLPKVNNR